MRIKISVDNNLEIEMTNPNTVNVVRQILNNLLGGDWT